MPNEPDDPRIGQNVVIGEALDRLSVDDLIARVAILKDEILRVEAAIEAKCVARDAAGSFFKM